MADWKDAFDAKTEDTTPDIDADFIWTKDTSADLITKVKPRNFLALYALLASPAFTGNPTAPTQSAGNNSTRLATTAYVEAAVAAAVTGLLELKGSTDCSGNPNYPAASKGDTYIVSVAGKIGGASGKSVDVGDLYIASADNAGGTEASVGTSWIVIEHNIVGGAGAVDDTAYDATTWNGDTTNAPSKNAVRDKIETLQPLDTDLMTIAGLTATTDNFMQSKSSAWASRTVAQVSADLQATGLVTDAVGFRTIPQNSQSTAYTTVAADSGKHILHPAGDANARTFTIDSNANVAYPVGTAITFVNETANVVTIAITSDTLTLAGTTTTGSRSLAQNGVATAIKVTTTKWIISGTGLT